MKPLRLSALGWDDRWSAAATNAPMDTQPARVVGAGRLLLVQTAEAEVLAQCPWLDDSRADLRPVCGDWVMVDVHPTRDPTQARGLVRALLPRKNAIARKAVGTSGAQTIAANLDAVWLVCGLDRDQGLRSLRRYQALTRIDGVRVSIVLTKLDRVQDPASVLASARIQAPDLPIVALSARSPTDVAKLAATLVRGTTTALLGPSGVGKSTLINALLPQAAQRTQSVRAQDCRGRHTTSAARLVETPEGAMLIDTPGLRELGLWPAASGIDESFSDIVELSLACRFRDCKHDCEPGCAVRSAIERGDLHPERFVNYLELRQECRSPPKRKRH